MFSVGGTAVLLGIFRFHSLRILISGTDTSRAVGEAIIVGALGMSLALIAHNLPSMRLFWTHVTSSLAARNASRRLCEAKSHIVIQHTIALDTGSAGSTTYGAGSFSRPILPSESATSRVERPLALRPGSNRPWYPNVDEDFGTQPRTPPSTV